jgi:hypothetical protein
MSEDIFYLLSLTDKNKNLKEKSTLLRFSDKNFRPVKYKGSLCYVDFLRQQQNLWLCQVLNVGTLLPVSFLSNLYIYF